MAGGWAQDERDSKKERARDKRHENNNKHRYFLKMCEPYTDG